MKKTRFLFSMVLILSLVFNTILFTKDTTTALAASTVRISSKALTLELGRYQTLKVYGTSKKATWHSSNSWVASVSGSGRVTARAAGTATITARVAGKKLTTKVTVLRMKGKDLTLVPGKAKTITIEGTKSKISWATDNKSVATVSTNGKVTAKAPGTATITATVDGKELIGKVTVLALNHESVVLEKGGLYGFIKTLKLNDIDNSKVSWSSDDTSIATIGRDGRVRAQNPGTATITAEYKGSKLTSTIKVLEISNKEFTLKMGKQKTLEIFGTDSEIKWESNKKTVATVSENGTVSTVEPGAATISGFVDGRRVTARVTVVQ